MDCRAYCTASSCRIKFLYEHLKNRFKTTSFRDVIHVEVPSNSQIGHVFYFSYGAIVCWGLAKNAEEEMVREVKEFQEHSLDEIETDEFTYCYGETAKIVEDEITLPNKEIITKLAFSQGIAQSVKLGVFEIAVQKSYNQSKNIPEDLAKRGKVSLSKKEIRKKMGELFIERNSINLHVDVLGAPEFFWEYPELEPFYKITANYLDIQSRVSVLNQRLNVIHELFQMLETELNHQHSSRLEWTIIWLIISEVVLTIMRDVLKII